MTRPRGTSRSIESTVREKALGDESSGAIGLLEQDEGGFGLDMWQGTDHRLVVGLLPYLADDAPSQTLYDLARRLLVSNAKAPEGTADGIQLLALRVGHLAAMGEFEAVDALIGFAPTRNPNESGSMGSPTTSVMPAPSTSW